MGTVCTRRSLRLFERLGTRLLHTASNGKGDKDNEIHAALLFQKTRLEYEGVKGQVENLF